MATLEELIGDVADDVVFRGVQATGAEHAIVIAVLRSREAERQDHSFFLVYEAGEWRRYFLRSVTSSFCIEPDRRFYVLTPHGFVIRVDDEGFESEHIDPGQTHVNSLRNATEIISREQGFYVAGMGRELFRGRYGQGWVPLLGPELTRAPDAELGGFLSVELDATGVLHAVGFHGEIGYLDAGKWHEVCSPTNLRLTRIRRSHAGQLLACGSAGVLLRGRQDAWAAIEHGIEENLWDIAHVGDSTFVAGSEGLYRVDAELEVSVVDFIVDGELGSGFLSGAGSALWSVGHGSIARLVDEQWTVLWPPASLR